MRRPKIDLVLFHADGYEEKIKVTTASAIRIIYGFLNDGASISVMIEGETIIAKTDAWNRFKLYGDTEIII